MPPQELPDWIRTTRIQIKSGCFVNLPKFGVSANGIVQIKQDQQREADKQRQEKQRHSESPYQLLIGGVQFHEMERREKVNTHQIDFRFRLFQTSNCGAGNHYSITFPPFNCGYYDLIDTTVHPRADLIDLK